MKTIRTNETARHLTEMGVGKFDEKGREIGLSIRTFECEFVVNEEALCFYSIEPGHYYAANVQVTRDGKRFGASQSDRYFKTREERDLYLARRWKEILK